MTVDELKAYLNIDEDNTAHDTTLADLISAAQADLLTATGKTFGDDEPLVRQYIKLFAKREFDALTDNAVDNRLLDIQRKILLSGRWDNAQSD